MKEDIRLQDSTPGFEEDDDVNPFEGIELDEDDIRELIDYINEYEETPE